VFDDLQRPCEHGNLHPNDVSFAAAHEAVLVALEGDDSFIAGVVANEPLTEEEEKQWICRIRTRLKVPCGRLLVCGGFDPRSLEDFKEQGPREDMREVRVPPGEYRVDISSLDWVGYVVHLHAPDEAELSTPTDGWFDTDCAFRRPVRFPMGLPVAGAEDPEYRSELEAILPRQPKPKPSAPP